MSSIKQAVIISAVRTPVGKFLGALKSFKATDLGAIVVREAVKRAGCKPEDVDEVIMGCVIQAGLGQNPARQAALRGGLPNTVSAVTVNKVCGSGLKAVMLAAQAIKAGDAECVVAGFRWHKSSEDGGAEAIGSLLLGLYDDATEAAVMGAIMALGDAVTIILIAHRASTLAACDRIIRLREGKVVEGEAWTGERRKAGR